MVENRLEWTISRQRRWGSPITFLRCTDCREKGVVSHYPAVAGDVTEKEKREREEFFERVRETFRLHGADAWYDDERLPPVLLSKQILSSSSSSSSAACARCGGDELREGQGHPRRLVRLGRVARGRAPVGRLRARRTRTRRSRRSPVMYLEGHDQHRGWFQSSLLTSVALTDRAPYDAVLTHGFVVAGDGRKMSKSLGNTVEPHDVLKTDGADVIRLWVASLDYTNDDPVSEEILKRTAEAYRKIRNTARFLLGNLFDFDPTKDAVAEDRIEPLDRYILDVAARVAADCRAAYEALCVPRGGASPPRVRDVRPLGLLVRRPQGHSLRRKGRRPGPAVCADRVRENRRDAGDRPLAALSLHGGGDLGSDSGERVGSVRASS